MTLAFFIQIPESREKEEKREPLWLSAKKGITYLKKEWGIFNLILFLAAINLVASIYDAAFPAMMLSRNGGSEKVLGLVNAVIGISTFTGSILAFFIKTKKPDTRNLQLSAIFHEYGKLPFGIWKDAFYLVHRRISWLDCNSNNEH